MVQITSSSCVKPLWCAVLLGNFKTGRAMQSLWGSGRTLQRSVDLKGNCKTLPIFSLLHSFTQASCALQCKKYCFLLETCVCLWVCMCVCVFVYNECTCVLSLFMQVFFLDASVLIWMHVCICVYKEFIYVLRGGLHTTKRFYRPLRRLWTFANAT